MDPKTRKPPHDGPRDTHSRVAIASLRYTPFRRPIFGRCLRFNTDELLTELRELLDGPWAAPLREAGVEYTTELVGGDPALELLRVAERVDASMLVLGSKGRSTLADLVVGGTVHKLINRCTVPVVVVPRSRPVKEDA